MNSSEKYCTQVTSVRHQDKPKESVQDSGWDYMKQKIENQLHYSLDEGRLVRIEPFEHSFYEKRIKYQKVRKIDREELGELWEMIDKGFDDLMVEIDAINLYIMAQIPVDPASSNVGKTR